MKYCTRCKINVVGDLTYCPLCQNELTQLNTTHQEEIFPNTYTPFTANHMILKILGFLSVIVGIFSLYFNIVYPTRIWWSVIVIITFGCAWLSLAIAITKHRNIHKYLLYQSIIICIFSVIIDFCTDFHGWSITFVLPITFTLAMIVMYLLSKILKLQAGDYIIYLLLDALFGIIPYIFLINGSVHVTLPSVVCMFSSIVSVAALIIFEGKSILNELNRRLHI